MRTSEVGDDSVCRLWIMDVASASAAPVCPEQRLNSVLGSAIRWMPDSSSLIIKRPVGTREDAPAPRALPSSPSVQQSSGDGAKAAVRTYPNLLSSKEDAVLFTHYATVELVHLELASLGGRAYAYERPLGPPGLFTSFEPSPDGSHLLTCRLRPDKMSYAVPWPRFGRTIEVQPVAPLLRAEHSQRAEHSVSCVVLQSTDALESMPIGHDACRAGPRAHRWRPEEACTLVWCEALDGGDPKVHAAERDRLMLARAPFDAPPVELMRTKTRFQSVRWAADGSALVWERWYHQRLTRVSRLLPNGEVTPYMEYDYSDAYAHPGAPLVQPGPYGRAVLRLHDGGHADGPCLLWEGAGASEDGLRPFVDARRLVDGVKVCRLWRAAVGCYDDPYAVLHTDAAAKLCAPKCVPSGDGTSGDGASGDGASGDGASGDGASGDGASGDGGGRFELLLVTRRQTQSQPPQMLLKGVAAECVRSSSSDAPTDDSTLLATLSAPLHPQPALSGIQKSLLRYDRADGVGLSGTLYLPAGYEPARDGPLPTLLWAYPREFKSKASAGQVRGSAHTFTTVHWGSPLYWLTRGYAVLDGFSMPIVGEGAAHENDDYVHQLQMNAAAAVDELRRRGIADHRLAIGGHSYGAFMAANLLARCPELFCAGIARNGAYNRTLTPFGFQAEERSFWEAASTYAAMSPFHHADRIRAPLLLIHGEDDPNPGTFPMQSERLYAAIKGLGGSARLVLLPNEGHWYRARESILHTLAEQDAWLEAHVKHAKPPQHTSPSPSAPSAAPTAKL